MVIRYLHVERVAVNEAKTDPPLKVDGKRTLPFAFPFQCMETVTGKSLQVVQAFCDVQVLQASFRSLPDVGRKPFRFSGLVQLPCMPVSERLDHASTVTRHVTLVNTESPPNVSR